MNAQSCLTLYGPMDCRHGTSVHRIFQSRMLEWLAIACSRDLLEPEIEPASPAGLPCLAGGFFTFSTTWIAL